MAKHKLEKYGVERVEFIWRYDAKEEYDHPRIVFYAPAKNGYFDLNYQRNRLDMSTLGTLRASAYDIRCYRRGVDGLSGNIWDVGAAPYSNTYGPALSRVYASAEEVGRIAGILKVIEETEAPQMNTDPMLGVYQKILALRAPVAIRYLGQSGEFNSPYELDEKFRGHTRKWAYSPEACRLMAEYELKEAERKEAEVNSNQEVA